MNELKWFHYRQNNSGGRFVINDNVDVHVLIQAPNAKMANYFAERIGIYFHGVENEWDCECCGDRWSKCDNTDGAVDPEIYGDKVNVSILDKSSTCEDPGDKGGGLSVKVYPFSVVSNV